MMNPLTHIDFIQRILGVPITNSWDSDNSNGYESEEEDFVPMNNVIPRLTGLLSGYTRTIVFKNFPITFPDGTSVTKTIKLITFISCDEEKISFQICKLEKELKEKLSPEFKNDLMLDAMRIVLYHFNAGDEMLREYLQ